jgi:hypothetical protein
MPNCAYVLIFSSLGPRLTCTPLDRSESHCRLFWKKLKSSATGRWLNFDSADLFCANRSGGRVNSATIVAELNGRLR